MGVQAWGVRSAYVYAECHGLKVRGHSAFLFALPVEGRVVGPVGERDHPTSTGGISMNASTKKSSQHRPPKTRRSPKRSWKQKVLGKIGLKSVRRRAEQYTKEPQKLYDLLEQATAKAQKKKRLLSRVWDDLELLFRMLRAYIKGQYREIPLQTLVLIVGAIIYFLIPTDLIPDPIVVLGYGDDAAVVGLVINSIKEDIDEFRKWEQRQPQKEA